MRETRSGKMRSENVAGRKKWKCKSKAKICERDEEKEERKKLK